MRLIFGRKLNGRLYPSLTSPPLYGLIGHMNSNFAGDLEDQKSVMGYYFFLNGTVVSWSSKKQRTISTSITKVEYIMLGHIARKAMWIKKFINEIRLKDTIESIILHSDNKISIVLTKNVESQYHMKHINV